MKTKLKTKIYSSPRSIVKTWIWLVAGRKKDENGFEIGFIDETGRSQRMSLEEHIDAVSRSGLWGFLNHKTGTIHVWFHKKTQLRDLVRFFGHEIGHATGTPYRRLIKEEKRVEQYEILAEQAYLFAKRARRLTKAHPL